jgi:hypothetical protein
MITVTASGIVLYSDSESTSSCCLLRPSGGRGYEEGEDLGKGTGVHGVDVPNWYGEKEEAVTGRVTKGAQC